MGSNNTVSLVFLGDEKKLTQALDKIGTAGKTLTGDINKTSTQSVAALDKIGTATTQLGTEVTKSAGKSSTALAGVGQAADKMTGDIGKSAGQAAGKLGDIDKAGKNIKDVDMKISISSPGTSEIDKVSKAGNNVKPIKVSVEPEVDSGKAKETLGKFKEIGAQGAEVFGVGFLSGIASGGFASSLASIVGDSFKAAQENGKLKIDLQNQMGLSPDDAKKYGDRLGSMYAEGLGDSKDQIAGAYSSLSSDVKDWASLNSGAQDMVVKDAVKVAQAFKIDVNDAVKGASAMVRTGLVPSYKDAFDLITTGYQTLGSRGDDAIQTVTEYSTQFTKLGFSGQEALGLIKQGLDAGIRDTDSIADAWKELSIRIVDGSSGTVDALKSLGLNAKQVPEQIAQGGPAAEAAVGKIIDKLKAIKDPVEKNRIGFELFGTMWEDTMGKVIGTTDLAIAKQTEFSGATDKLVSNTSTQADILGRRWERGLGVLGEGLSGFLNNTLSKFDGGMGNFAHDMLTGGSLAEGLGEKVKGTSDIVRVFQDIAKAGATMKVQLEDQAMVGLQAVEDKLKGLPPKKAITVQSLSAEAVADLEHVGYKVTTLPNGQFRVQAETKDAYGRLAGLLADYGNRNLQWNVTVKTFMQALPFGLGHADGGWIRGPGTGRSDSIPLMGSNGEFIVSADKAGPNAAALEAINSGQSWSPSMSGTGPAGGYSGSGGATTALTLRVSGNADSAVGTLINTLINNGVIQLN